MASGALVSIRFRLQGVEGSEMAEDAEEATGALSPMARLGFRVSGGPKRISIIRHPERPRFHKAHKPQNP